MVLLQLVEEVELVPSLADSEDEDEPRRPLLLELLPVGPESDAPVSKRSSRSCRDITWRSREIRMCGRRAPELPIDVAPRIGKARIVEGQRHSAAQMVVSNEDSILV